MGMSLVVKEIGGVWMVKGSADPDSNYQSLRSKTFLIPLPEDMTFSPGDFVDLLLLRYPNSTIQILGE